MFIAVTICYLFRHKKTYISHDERLSLREKAFLLLSALLEPLIAAGISSMYQTFFYSVRRGRSSYVHTYQARSVKYYLSLSFNITVGRVRRMQGDAIASSCIPLAHPRIIMNERDR